MQKANDADMGPLTWPHLRQVCVLDCGGEEGDRLRATHERSVKRALELLVKRGDVLKVGGKGGPSDPYRYTTVEAFAGAAEGKKVTDAAEAKKIAIEFLEMAKMGF